MMHNKILILILCSLQLFLSSHIYRPKDGDVHVYRYKRIFFRAWTFSSYSECTVICGGGFMTRSVRCLDEDGVIVNDCNVGLRPSSIDFCNQIDCVTMNTSLLPPSGTYNRTHNDGSTAHIEFESQGDGINYMIVLTVTEVDNTRTVVEETASSLGVQTRINIMNASNSINIEQSGSLVADGETILNLNDVERINITNVQRITYQTNTINILNGNELANNINTFHYYDGLRFYRFDGNKMNSLRGFGVLYSNNAEQIAIFSINSAFNIDVSTFLDSPSTTTDTNAGEVMTTDNVSTNLPTTTAVDDVTTSSTTDDVTPTIDDDTPTTDDVTPNTDDVPPNTDDVISTTAVGPPTTDDVISTTAVEPPTTDDVTPTTDDVTPTTDDVTPTTDDAISTNAVGPLTTDNVTPTADGAISTNAVGPPTTDDVISTTAVGPPTTDDVTPTSDATNAVGPPTTDDVTPTDTARSDTTAVLIHFTLMLPNETMPSPTSASSPMISSTTFLLIQLVGGYVNFYSF